MDINQFKQLPILGILRGVESHIIEPLVETVISAGLKTIEITMNTPGAPDLISQTVKVAQNRLTVGAGTVLTDDDAKSAITSGASFIVQPTLVKDVTEFCNGLGIPIFPGALTPQEIYDAWNAGASMVKVFPAKAFGPDYFKEIKGPFQNIELLACGGINSNNIQEYFSCGASAAAFGGSIFSRERFETKDFDSIKKDIESLISAYKTNSS